MTEQPDPIVLDFFKLMYGEDIELMWVGNQPIKIIDIYPTPSDTERITLDKYIVRGFDRSVYCNKSKKINVVLWRYGSKLPDDFSFDEHKMGLTPLENSAKLETTT
jgi:hypothetical protein